MNIGRIAVFLAISLLGTWSAAQAAADGSQLELPGRAKVAIVVFEDLQCPDCAKVHPALLQAAKTSKVPLVIHDFPIPRHAWAFPAAVLARYFAQQSPKLGTEFRSFIFQNQPDINPENLRSFAERFAEDRKLQLPAIVDPEGVLKAAVQADFDLGRQIKLEYVPLIFVIGRGQGAAHFVEVTDPAQLSDVIAQMRKGHGATVMKAVPPPG
jgi:protein-disulfide isomerase